MSPGAAPLLPAGVLVLERGWLSSNSVVLRGASEAAVVDSGYVTHAGQTLDLVARAAGGLPVATLVNTHLHSDHCGGNAALQARYPGLRTLIPAGQAEAVQRWDTAALTYGPTGQQCARFSFTAPLQPGTSLHLGYGEWQVHSAPGHDPHSVVLFDPRSRTLISADALWENGFGVVFPELEGADAFGDTARTFDVIERLGAVVVIPGHGAPFTDVTGALARARSRLAAYVSQPARHAAHAAKVLLKFRLLEIQQCRRVSLLAWAEETPYFDLVRKRWFADAALGEWVASLLLDLARSGAARLEGDLVLNA